MKPGTMRTMEKQRRVFVLEPTEYSMAKAKRFGQLVFLFGDESLRPHATEAEFSRQVLAKLKELEFDPEFDFVAASGEMVAVVAFVALVAAQCSNVTILLFDHREGQRVFKVVEANPAVPVS